MNLIINWIIENKLWLLLGIGTLYTFDWLNSNHQILQLSRMKAFVISILHTIQGLVCLKTFAINEVGFDLDKAGNMSIYGAMFFMPIFYFSYAKITNRKLRDVYDVFTIGMLFTLLCARVNCIFSGCCLGKPIFAESSICWPTRQMEIVFYIIIIVILKSMVKKKGLQGKVFPIYMICYGIFRFVIEFLRVGTPIIGEMFHMAHVWSIIAIGIGFVLLFMLNNRKNNI